MDLATNCGCTVGELQQRMTVAELQWWTAKYKRYGTLSVTRKMEQMLGRLTHLTAVANGAKSAKIWDYAPNEYPKHSARRGRAMTKAEHEAKMRQMQKMYEV